MLIDELNLRKVKYRLTCWETSKIQIGPQLVNHPEWAVLGINLTFLCCGVHIDHRRGWRSIFLKESRPWETLLLLAVAHDT